jgi:hypothetical protein
MLLQWRMQIMGSAGVHIMVRNDGSSLHTCKSVYVTILDMCNS